MKKALVLCVLVALVGTASFAAGSHSLNATGDHPGFAPIPPPELPEVADLSSVNDGSFEAGGNCGGGTSAWTETDLFDCGPWIGDWGPTSCTGDTVFPTSAVDGIQSYWAGGFCGFLQSLNTATQTVTIPTDSDCTLSFWWASAMNGDDDSVFYISMDGTDIWTLDAILANDTAGVFGSDSANFCDFGFVPGQTVALQLGVVDATLVGAGGNVLFDYLQWGLVPNVLEVPTVNRVGLIVLALLLVGAMVVLIRRLG